MLYHRSMQVTIFGANGKIGTLVVTELLARKNSVKAFVHNHATLPENVNLTVVKGDIHSATDVSQALQGSQAVISALGSWGTPQKDILGIGFGLKAKSSASRTV